MDKLILLSNPERIPSHDEAGNGYALGWTFTVALAPDSSADGEKTKAFLAAFSWNDESAPGFWGPVEKLFLFRRNAPGPLWSVTPEAIPLEKSIDAGTAIQAYRKELSRQLTNTPNDCLYYEAEHRNGIQVTRTCRPWPAFLAEQACEAFPLPQALGLSRFAYVPAAPGETTEEEWLIFPVLRVRNSTNDGWDDILDVTLDVSSEPAHLAYGQVNVTTGKPEIAGLQVEAQSMILGKKVGDSSLSNLWVENLQTPDDDWRAGFEDRLAGELDPGPIFAGWMATLREKADKDRSEVARTAVYKLASAAAVAISRSTFLPRAGEVPTGYTSEWQLLAAPKDRAKVGEALRRAASFFAASRSLWAGWIERARRGTSESTSSYVFLEALASETHDKGGLMLERFPIETLIREIESLSEELATPEVARRLFDIQMAAFTGHGSTSSSDKQAIEALRKALPAHLNFRRIQLKVRLAVWWEALLGALGQTRSQDEARDKLKTQLARDSSNLPLASWISEAGAANFGLLRGTAEAVAARVLMVEAPPDRRAGPSRGISLQVHSLGAESEKNDLLRQIRGVGVLMRRKSGGKWRCLNEAFLQVRVDNEYKEVSNEAGVLPSRLAYVAGLSAPLLTYDNAPLTVPGPLELRETTGYQLAGNGGDLPALLHFERNPKGKLPGLAFGETYEFLAFLVSNSGILPKALARSGSPWQMVDLDSFNPGSQSAIPRPKERKYLREVQVGSCRFGETRPGSENAPTAVRDGMPPIPRGVSPKARELPLETLLHPRDPLLQGRPAEDETEDGVHAQLPLLLLASSKLEKRPGVFVPEEFRFHLQPPAIDLETWDRWRAADFKAAPSVEAKDKIRNDRRSVRLATYVLSQESAGAYLENDRSLDDPAIVGLWYEVKEVWPDSAAKAILRKAIDFAQVDAPNLTDLSAAGCRKALEVRRRPATRFRIRTAEGPPDPQAGEDIPLAAGNVYRFCTYAILDPMKAAGYVTRFSPKSDQEVRLEDGRHLTSPWHLLIETAPSEAMQQRLPLEQLAVDFHDETDSLVLTAEPEKAYLYHRAEVLQQVWRWQGREPIWSWRDREPPLEDAIKFEMSEFGDRSDDEHRRRPMKPVMEKKKGVQKFEFLEQILRSGPTGDPRAQYHRLSARLYSRYEGLLPEEDSFSDFGDGNGNRWKSKLIPCRFTGEVPTPNVTMVLPLTGGEDGKQESPGLMVVVDGPWYQVGGLAESLEVEVIDVASPDCNLGEECDNNYFQIGTDPIVTSESIGKLLGLEIGAEALSTKEAKVLFSDVQGAIGLQRDRSATDPYFLASTFLLSQPTILIGNDEKKKDLSWAFLKLRFRRVLKLRDGTLKKSAPTAPFWVQLLPGMARIEEDYFPKPARQGYFEARGGIIEAPTENSKPFHLVGLVTRKIHDAAGRRSQEAYVDLAWPKSGSFKVEKSLEPSGDYLIRWLVLQRREVFGEGDRARFWDLLFDPKTRDKDRARIVRMSLPNRLEVR